MKQEQGNRKEDKKKGRKKEGRQEKIRRRQRGEQLELDANAV